MFKFRVVKKLNAARLTDLVTPHGTVQGPFFQFVATQAAIRGQVFSEDLEKLGVQITLANTYHLHVRPGEDVVKDAGGLHGFMRWGKPITTDSGGYQVFSLGQNLKIDSDGVTFQSPLNGDKYRLTPEKTMQIEADLGADIVMPLDIATRFDADKEEVKKAVDQTYAWAQRCKDWQEENQPPQALYGIVQGALFEDLRERSASQLVPLDFFGYSIGGELRDATGSRMQEGVEMTIKRLPEEKPRYLMGAGSPTDIVKAVRAGVDQFDCVLPIRDARHGRIYRNLNKEVLQKYLEDPEQEVMQADLYDVVDITKAKHARDWSAFAPENPVIEKDYTVGYVHHLMRAEAPSGFRLCVLNNIHFYAELMEGIRDIIAG